MKKHVGIKDFDGDTHDIYTWDNPADVVSEPFFIGEYWEKHLQPIIKEAMKHGTPESVSLDIGANIGAHTVYMKKLGNVWAFEPQSKTFEILKANAEASRSAFEAKLFNCGLSNVTDAGFTLTVPGENNNGAGVISKTNEGESIRVERFDEIWARHGKPKIDFIKIDVEGHELPALRGAREAIRHSSPVIAFEDWFEPNAVQSPVIEFLQNRNYRIKVINLPNDFLAVPPNRVQDFAQYKDFVSGSIQKKNNDASGNSNSDGTATMIMRKKELSEVCESDPDAFMHSMLLMMGILLFVLQFFYIRQTKRRIATFLLYSPFIMYLAVKIMIAAPDVLEMGCLQHKAAVFVSLGCLLVLVLFCSGLFLQRYTQTVPMSY